MGCERKREAVGQSDAVAGPGAITLTGLAGQLRGLGRPPSGTAAGDLGAGAVTLARQPARAGAARQAAPAGVWHNGRLGEPALEQAGPHPGTITGSNLVVTGSLWVKGGASVGPAKRAPTPAAGALTAGTLNGNGKGLTALDAMQLKTGTLPSARLSGTYNSPVIAIGDGTFDGNVLGRRQPGHEPRREQPREWDALPDPRRLSGIYTQALTFNNSGNALTWSPSPATAAL